MLDSVASWTSLHAIAAPVTACTLLCIVMLRLSKVPSRLQLAAWQHGSGSFLHCTAVEPACDRHCMCRRALTKDVLSTILRQRQTHPQYIWKGGFRDEVCTKHMKEHPWKTPLHCKSNTFILARHLE